MDSFEIPFRGGWFKTSDRFLEFFKHRDHYTVNSSALVARYENPDTGAQFQFIHATKPPQPQWLKGMSVVFDLGYLKPDFFAIEAIPEIKSLIQNLSLKIHSAAIISAPHFNEVEFLQEWRYLNFFQLKKFLFNGGSLNSFGVMPDRDIEFLSTWNVQLGKTKLSLEDIDCGVPKLSFFRHISRGPSILLSRTDSTAVAVPASFPGLPIFFAYQNRMLDLTLLRDAIVHRSDKVAIVYFTADVIDRFRRSGEPMIAGENEVLPMDSIVSKEDVEKALQSNKLSTKTCLAPPRNWE